jgi:acetolactate synthase-1/2/3 large subunit
MGAKLAKPDKLCINVWRRRVGFTGMDFEAAVRSASRSSILLNNFFMAMN